MTESRSQYLHDICPFLAGFDHLSVKFCWWNAKYGGPAAPALPLVRRCDPPDNGWWPETLMTEELEKLILDPTSAGSKHQLLWIFHNHSARQEILQWGLGLDLVKMVWWCAIIIEKSRNHKMPKDTLTPSTLLSLPKYLDNVQITWIFLGLSTTFVLLTSLRGRRQQLQYILTVKIYFCWRVSDF